MSHYLHLQAVPGRAGGGSFRRKKWHIARKEFAYRMCARRPTSAMPKPFLCCERACCCSMVVMWPVLMQCWLMWCAPMWFDAMWLLVLCHVTWCNAMSCDVCSRIELSSVVPCNGMEPKMPLVVRSHCVFEVVIQSTILYYKALFCTTKYYSTTTLYDTVLLQYYSVLQITTPVLLCTTKYYSSTTLYCKVLLQYYSVLQGTTPVLLCTEKYYSSTSLYCKVLLQYYSVLQSTTPVLLCTTQYYNVLLQYYSVLQSITLYCKVLLQYYSVLQSTTPVLLCTTKYYSSTTLYYTVLQLATPVLHCTTKQHSWLMSVAYETSFTMRGTTGVILQRHEILHLPRKMTVMIDPCHIWNVIYNERSNRNHNPSSPNTAPDTQNECHQWSASHMKRHFQCAEQVKSPSKLTNYCACHAKWISWLIRVTYETSFRMRGATRVTLHLHQILRLPRKMNLMIDPPQSFRMRGASKVNLEPHQILRLPRKMHLMIDPRHIWNVI